MAFHGMDLAKQDLFRQIDAHPQIQKYMDEISSKLSSLITCMSFFDAVYRENRKNDYAHVTDTFDVPEPWEFHRSADKIMHLKATPNFRDSGSVMPADVKDVFEHGNVRERCYQILTIFCREKKATIIKWLLFTQNETMPSFLNRAVISQFRHILAPLGDEVTVDQKIATLKKKLFVVSEKRQRLRRSVEQMSSPEYGIDASGIIPPISSREKKVINLSPEAGGGSLPWVTGRQQWCLTETMQASLKRHNPNHEIISGLSGHSEGMLVFLRLFKCFDIRKTALVCVLWLAPCDHHSVYEVLHTCKIHGLRYSLDKDPIAYCHSLLQSL